MSEEELGEGGLGLRARAGGGRPVAGHGQVLVQGSEEREELLEGEAPEDEIRASLLQLLDQDLMACDVQLSLFVAAASSYRQVQWYISLLLLPLTTFEKLRSGHNTPTFSSFLPDQQWGEGCGRTAGRPCHPAKS